MSHPVRWASTATSAQRTRPGSAARVRCAARMSRSVQGAARQSGPQVPERGDTMSAGDAVAAGTGGFPGGTVRHRREHGVVHPVGEDCGLARAAG